MTQRIITGVCLAAGALVLIYFGGTVLALTAIVCFTFAMHEEYAALKRSGHRTVSWPTWLAMILCVPLAAIIGAEVTIPVLMSACLITIICVVFRSDPQLEDAQMSLLPLFSVLLPGIAVVSLCHVQPLSVQRTLLAVLIATPVLGDSLAFFVGTRFGGPKFCPQVSPNKTISGAVGGIVGSVAASFAVGAIAHWMCAPSTWPLLPTWWGFAVLGIVGGVASQMGDLFASLIKRHCGIKDFSNLFPGHGGMLDRLDSILFMAVVVWCYRVITL